MNVQNPRFNHPRSIMFDGVGYIRNTTSHQLGIANTWTMMASFRMLASASNASIFQTNQVSGANRIFLSVTPNSTFFLEIRDSANAQIKSYTYALTAQQFFTNRWVNIAATWDGTTLQAYVNGVATAPTTLNVDTTGTMTDTTTRNTAIGASSSGSSQTISNISQVALWNSVLTASEIASIATDNNAANMDLRASIGNYVSYANLRHWWLCGASGIVQDLGSSPFGTVDLSANLSGITEAANCIGDTPSETSYNRWHEYCLDMDGSTERMRSVTARTIDIANAWSVCFFSKSGRDTTQETILEFRSGATSNDRIRFQKRGDVSNGRLEIDIYDSSASVIKDYSFNNVLTVGAWVGVCATWDGTNLLVYVNGVQTAPSAITSNGSGTMGTTTRQVGFGVGAAADQFYQGRCHSAMVWSTALTPDQASFVSRPYVASWLAFNTNGMGYTSASTLVQWFRQALGSKDGSTSGNTIAANDVLTTSIIAGGLTQGQVNMTLGGDIFRDFPS